MFPKLPRVSSVAGTSSAKVDMDIKIDVKDTYNSNDRDNNNNGWLCLTCARVLRRGVRQWEYHIRVHTIGIHCPQMYYQPLNNDIIRGNSDNQA